MSATIAESPFTARAHDFKDEAQAYTRAGNTFLLDGRMKEVRFCKILAGKMNVLAGALERNSASHPIVSLGSSYPKPIEFIHPEDITVTVERMVATARCMGVSVPIFGASEQTLQTPLVQLPLDGAVIRRLGDANVTLVGDVLGKTEKDLVMPTYRFGDKKFVHLLAVFAHVGIYPKLPELERSPRPHLGVSSIFHWGQQN